MINSTDILKIWAANKAVRDAQTLRQNYYDGKHSFLSKPDNTDGTLKSAKTVNWCDYVVDAHVSASTKNPYQITLRNDDADKAPLDALSSVVDDNDIPTLEAEHFRTALVMGYSIEVHSFTDGDIKVKQYDPREWVVLFDENKDIHAAIHQAVILPNTYLAGLLITANTTIYTVYDSENIGTYIVNAEGNLSEASMTPHPYGKVPIVVFSVTETRIPFLSENIMGQNDIYNVIGNARIDELTYNVDSGLKLTGFEFDPTKKEDVAKLQAMKNQGVFILPDTHSDIAFMTKGSEEGKYASALSDAREALLSQAKVPDIREIMSAIGNVSGLAIKFRYQPMENQANFFWKYLQSGIRKRIQLLNTIWSVQAKAPLENFKTIFNFSTPIDVLAERLSLAGVSELYSTKTLMEISPDIDDPEQEMKRLAVQNGNLVDVPVKAQSIPAAQAPEERAKAQEEALQTAVGNVEKRMREEMFDTLRDTLPSVILESDKVKAFLAQSND